MVEGALSGLVTVLAFAGGFALVSRLAGTSLRLVLLVAEGTAAARLAEVSASRGDVTGMMERRTAARTARRSRRVTLLLAIAWLLWLAVPVLGEFAREAYAFAAVLWLFPKGRVSVGGSVQVSSAGGWKGDSLER